MTNQIIITEKTSQARDVRAAIGSRYDDILPAEGHLFDLLEPEMAASRLAGEALPVPARSKAVPWSGEVRTIGSPRLMFTAASNATVLIGISAWS